jgi:hypothetical protein
MHKVDAWRASSQEAARLHAQAEAQRAADERSNVIAAQLVATLAKFKANSTANNMKVLDELKATVYSTCILPDSGRMLNNANADSVNSALGIATVVSPRTAVGTATGYNGGLVSGASGFDAEVRRLRAQAQGAAGASSTAAKGN